MGRDIKLFVAGAFKHRKTIHDKYVVLLRELGFQITFDWTVDRGRQLPGISYNEMMARLDTMGVNAADLMVVIMDDTEYNYRGTWVEIGMAIARNMPVLVYFKDEIGDKIYLEHPRVRIFREFDALLKLLLRVKNDWDKENSSRMSRRVEDAYRHEQSQQPGNYHMPGGVIPGLPIESVPCDPE